MPKRPPRAVAGAHQTLEERWTIEAQTARNLDALSAEAAGDLGRAVDLYEQNVAEGFVGDLPYGRLVALYERRCDFAAAERVLTRAIDVFAAATTRTAQDRRATLRVFKNRLAALRKGLTSKPPAKGSVRQDVAHRQGVGDDQQ